jgi:adenylate cyclase
MGGTCMTATGLACAACGTDLPETSKFCNECGAAVSAGAEPAEYKQVTVLFADVVHSMDIAAAVGAERLREIMTQLVNRAALLVQRYGGTVDKFTGDGIMAVFGAPVALEDHAFRACLAALGIQEEAARLAVEIQRHDGVDLRLRVGLNSGQVIAGDIGSSAFGYTAIGEQVGMAQRMESVAPPGGVMLSVSTARLVEDAVVLAEPEMVRIKGAKDAVAACRLIATTLQHEHSRRNDPTLVGRTWELNTIAAILDEAVAGAGGVISVLGPPGIGKSRIVRESAALAGNRGVEVFTTYCESHTSDISFHAVAGLSCAGLGVDGLDGEAARARIRARIPDADPADLLLLDDLLGIADPDIELPNIEADARRRRLTALVNAASVARREPAVCDRGRPLDRRGQRIAKCAASSSARRRRFLRGLQGSVSRDGEKAWLRRAYRDGRGNDMSAAGVLSPEACLTSLSRQTATRRPRASCAARGSHLGLLRLSSARVTSRLPPDRDFAQICDL